MPNPESVHVNLIGRPRVETTPALCDVRRGQGLWWHADQGGTEITIVRDDGVVVATLPAGGLVKTWQELEGEA